MTGDFLAYLVSEVDRLQKKWSLTKTGQAFMLWYAREALGLDEQAALDAVATEGANDKDLDMFYVDDSNERIVLGQGKFRKTGSYKGSKSDLLKLVHTTDWLENAQGIRREGRPELISASDDYSNARANGYSIEFQYVFMGTPTEEATDQALMFNNAALGEWPSKHVTMVDMRTLLSMYSETTGLEARISKGAIDLQPGCFYEQDRAYGRALTATVHASQLTRLYKEHGDELFARDVRLFLGARAGGVNAGIRDTLESISESTNFWAYNNGVTIVCDGYKPAPDGKTLFLDNFSIVNGCQTTVSLANAKAHVESAEVLLRVISAPEKLVDNIIFFTNSQTPVRASELRSQDKRQKKLKAEMDLDANPYFYCLRRGETRTLPKTRRARFTRDGSLQVIQRDDLAQYLAAFRGFPFIAYKDKGKIYSTYYDDVFSPDLRVEEAIFAWRAGQVASEQIERHYQELRGKDDRLSLFLLKRGGRLFVVSVMSILLSHRNGSNYLAALKRGVVTSKKTLERLATYAQVALTLYLMASRRIVGSGDIEGAASFLRTQESYPPLKTAIDEEWALRSIEPGWVAALPAF